MEALLGTLPAARDQTNLTSWCAESLAPGPCFAYWWGIAKQRHLWLEHAARGPEGQREALTFCATFQRSHGRAAHLGCLYGAAATSTYALLPRSPSCKADGLVRVLGQWLNLTRVAGEDGATGDSRASEDLGKDGRAVQVALIDGFVRRGAKYFPSCQPALCAAVPPHARGLCEAVVSGGMYPRERVPSFRMYMNTSRSGRVHSIFQ